MSNKILFTSIILVCLIATKAHSAPDIPGLSFAEDTYITAQVKTAFMTNQSLRNCDISVKTEKGVVFLSGNVEKRIEYDMAEKIAEDIKGVKSVINHIECEEKKKIFGRW
ncbi:MAG: BON domain-containing protein [Desulfovibrio sp.]|nr:BON domain-containing protein [Desulfovibrio sp.]